MNESIIIQKAEHEFFLITLINIVIKLPNMDVGTVIKKIRIDGVSFLLIFN